MRWIQSSTARSASSAGACAAAGRSAGSRCAGTLGAAMEDAARIVCTSTGHRADAAAAAAGAATAAVANPGAAAAASTAACKSGSHADSVAASATDEAEAAASNTSAAVVGTASAAASRAANGPQPLTYTCSSAEHGRGLAGAGRQAGPLERLRRRVHREAGGAHERGRCSVYRNAWREARVHVRRRTPLPDARAQQHAEDHAACVRASRRIGPHRSAGTGEATAQRCNLGCLGK